MEVAEFLVVTCASSLTLAIIGVFKEVAILTLAVIIKGNEITFINLCGMVICLMGIFAHVIRKTINSDEIQNTANPKKRFEEMSSSEDDLEFRHESRFNSMRSPIMTKEGKNHRNNILNTQYMRNPTFVSPVKIEYGLTFSISGLKMISEK